MKDQKQPQQKSEGLFSLIASAIKRNAEIPANFSLIAETLKTLAGELYKLKQNAATVSVLVNQHSEILKNIVDVQDYILNNMHEAHNRDPEAMRISRDKLNKLN